MFVLSSFNSKLFAAAYTAHFYCETRAIACGYTTPLCKTANLQMCVLTFINAC